MIARVSNSIPNNAKACQLNLLPYNVKQRQLCYLCLTKLCEGHAMSEHGVENLKFSQIWKAYL